jgi:hypothetical protein
MPNAYSICIYVFAPSNIMREVLLIIVIIILIYLCTTKQTETYRIGGGNGLLPVNEYGVGGWLTGAAGNGAICDCSRTPFTTSTKVYHDDTVTQDNGDDRGRHYKRVAYVGWDKPVVTTDFCRGWC